MATTRTLGPLHFEDLEPKRFEDLVRQLAYEFKPWRKLEATGRAGCDDGFDARGYEIVEPDGSPRAEDADGEPIDEAGLAEGSQDRLWLIQCKRERAIGPKALADHLDEMVLAPDETLHGLVFTAACDFSKKARDDFARKCKALGLQEWHLWGKAELEDRLFRPENDHLLFAYFGVSLTIRRRSQRTELRARLALKRKANRLLKDKENSHVLLRSPDAAEYPDWEDEAGHRNNPQWVVREYKGFSHEGLKFLVRRHFAYLADDGESWDAAMCVNDAYADPQTDPWQGKESWAPRRQAVLQHWEAFPEQNRAWLEVIGVVPFEAVMDIDELGDDHFGSPHVYTPFRAVQGPFERFYGTVETIGRWDSRSTGLTSYSAGRMVKFAEEYRERDDDAESPPQTD